MMQPQKILKITIYIALNILFGFIIFILSLRPLAPSQEQLMINYHNKSFYGFISECLIFVSMFTLFFSLLSFIVYILLFNSKDMKMKIFMIIAAIYFVVSLIFSVEYFNFINSIVFSKQ